MRKQYPSITRAKRAAAHARKLARKSYGQYDGEIQCYYDKAIDNFHYFEMVGSLSWMEGEDLVHICTVPVYGFDY